MTAVHREIIDEPSAWVNAPKENFLRQLSETELTTIKRLLDETRAIDPMDLTRDNFADPVLSNLVADVRREMRDGPGAIVLAGLTPDRFDEDDDTRFYLALGQHLGTRVIQNYRGDLLTRVEQEVDKDNPYDARTKGRGYRHAGQANYHTDTDEVVGLMCIRRAASGGESVITSATAIHNDFVRNHPELLDALYEGYWQAIGEDEVMTEEKSPVFGFLDGRLTVYCQFRAMRLAADKRGEPIPADLDAAMTYFYERAAANEAEFLLDDGEILLWNNRNQLHGRRKFEDSEERRRLLLRLWIHPDNPMRIPANFAEFTKQRLRHAEFEALQSAA